MVKSTAHLANAALLAGLFAGSVLVYDALPERIPMHFGLSGRPDRFAQTTLLRWLVLPLVALATAALCYGCAWAAERFPRLINLPDRARYDALAPAGKQKVNALGQHFLYWTTAGVLALLAALQHGSYVVAVGGAEQLPLYAGLGATLAFTVAAMIGTVWLVWKTQATITRLYNAQGGAASEKGAAP